MAREPPLKSRPINRSALRRIATVKSRSIPPRATNRGSCERCLKAGPLALILLEPGLVEALAGLLVYGRRDEVEVMFALAELLAARGDRALAWHAYQRALDLGHARRVDLPYYQQQLLPGLDRAARAELTETAHYRRRRRIVAWVDAWQAREHGVIAAGGDAERAEVWEAYLREHPRP